MLENLFSVWISSAASISETNSMNTSDEIKGLTQQEAEDFATYTEGYHAGSFKWTNEEHTEAVFIAEEWDRRTDSNIVRKSYMSLCPMSILDKLRLSGEMFVWADAMGQEVNLIASEMISWIESEYREDLTDENVTLNGDVVTVTLDGDEWTGWVRVPVR